MGQALYRKYRSKNLGEVIGQDHIVDTLTNALKGGKISHAYLFTGPRGVGKTSVARILAHEVNGFAYDNSTVHLDIIEIDAASNRRIDEIRDLRDKVNIAPTEGKYKVYIIDEVHMLTKEAFNALLKTLEEPPEHVIFILATTEAHKLPETIISRTQRFSFKPADNQKIIENLQKIAKAENISVDNEVLKLIAEHSEGSFRDSISLFDQASSGTNKVTIESVRQLLGIAPTTAIKELIAVLEDSAPKTVVNALDSLKESGYSSSSIAKQLIDALRSQLINDEPSLDVNETLVLINQLVDVPASTSPETVLEVMLLDHNLKNQPVVKTQKPVRDVDADLAPAKKDKQIKPKPTIARSINSEARQFDLSMWPSVLSAVKTKNNALYSVLRMAAPELNNSTLSLKFNFIFHQKRVSEAKNQQIIIDAIKQQKVEPITIDFVLDPKKPSATNTKAIKEFDVKTVTNIFGGGEMLDF